jgi:GNAT superfamily N-acetyltransferase
MTGLITELDRYFDAAPRFDADAVDAGAFTLFVSRSPFGYYARPALGQAAPIDAADLSALESVCAAHGVPLEIEWIHEVHPELAASAVHFGLDVRSHALMVASPGRVAASPPDRVAASPPDWVAVRVVEPNEQAIESGRAVAEVSFGFGGTGTGADGPAQRDARIPQLSTALMAHLRERGRAGRTVTAVAESDAGVLAVGYYQPVDGLAEVLAVATLPSARRQGLAGAVTALLANHAMQHGVRTVLLSAQDDDVARVYERVGFRRVGSTGAAQRRS